MSSDRLLAGIVLCGGRSRRMGTPKEWLMLGGETLLQRVVRQVAAVASPVIVVGRRGQALPELPDDVRVVFDEMGDQGPVIGLLTGLKVLGDETSVAWVTGCDYPFLVPAVVGRMRENCDEQTDAVVTVADGAVNPLPGIYRASAVSSIERTIAEGIRSIRALLRSIRTKEIPIESLRELDPKLRSFVNVNSPEESDRVRANFHRESM